MLDANRLKEAEPLMRRALAITVESFEPNHPEIAASLRNLAKLLRVSNRLAEAEPLLRQELVLLYKSVSATGHLHPNLRDASRTYITLLKEMNVPAGEIGRRLADIGNEVGFDVGIIREFGSA